MATQQQPDIFELSPDTFAARLKPVAEQAVAFALAAGLYRSYPPGPDALPNTFIHEYSNRKVLVEIDPMTGKEHFIKNL